MHRKLKNCLNVFLILFLLGCGSGSDNSDNEPSTYLIMGIATAGEPVSGADVSVFDEDGSLVRTFTAETKENGTFLVSVDYDAVQYGYYLEITGGRFESAGTIFNDVLKANVNASLVKERRMIHVGYASTLVSEFISRYGETDFDAAEAVVAEFLTIPVSQGLLTDINFYYTDFSESEFSSAASGYSSLDDFNTFLLNELELGRKHSFSGEPMPKGALAAAFAKGLVEGAGQQIGDRATGWVLDEIFGESNEPSVPTGEILDAITDVSNEIKEIRAELEKFQVQISQSLQLILTQTERNEYTTLVTSLSSSIVKIQRLHDTLLFITSHAAGYDDEDWKMLVNDFEKQLNIIELEEILRQFQRVMSGSTDTSSAINLWGNINIKYAFSKQNHHALFNQFEMYANLQLITLQLILEKRHKSKTGMPASYYVDLYLEGMKKQSEIFMSRVEAMMAVSQNTRLYNNSHPYRNTDWFVSISASHTLLNSSTRESAVLAEADNLVANYLVIEPALTVRLALPMILVPDNWIKDAPMVLVHQDTSDEYVPDTTYQYSPELPLTGHEPTDSNLWKQYWFINRYIFSDLPAGTYRIKNSINSTMPVYHGMQMIHNTYLEYDIIPASNRQSNVLITTYLNQ